MECRDRGATGVTDPYKTIGVDPDASPEEVKRAYWAKAKELHPDAGGDPSAFGDLAHAYAILRDPQARERYDTTGTGEEKIRSAGELAVHRFSQLFALVLDTLNTEQAIYSDIMEMMKEVVEQKHLDAERAIAAKEEELRKFEEVFIRTVEAGVDPLMGRTLYQKRQAAEKEIEALLDNIRVMEITSGLIRQRAYCFDTEEEAPLSAAISLAMGQWRPVQ